MTTAHRPTFKPSVGGPNQGGNVIIVPTRSYSSRDLPGYLTLKERQLGQGRKEELQYKDFKKELLEKEKQYMTKLKRQQNTKDLIDYSDDDDNEDLAQKSKQAEQVQNEPAPEKKIKLSEEPDQKPAAKKKIVNSNINPFPQDADNEKFIQSDASSSDSEDQQKDEKPSKKEKSESSSDSSSSDDEDSDDSEALMKEFEQLKQQKEQEEKLKAKQKDYLINQNRTQEILKGNPLLVDAGSYSLQKKWFEDTVFKNQARQEIQEKKRFINDNVRSDFHKKFMRKYIQM